MKKNYDVIVIGGGTAGVIAAIQAGRAGVSTLLIEKNGILGGTIVVGSINLVSSFHAYQKKVIAGIGWELCAAAMKVEGKEIDDNRNKHLHKSISAYAVNPALYAAIADEMVVNAGVDILFHAMPAIVKKNGDNWNLTICTKNGLQEVNTKVLIDCTGDANVVQLAGYEVIRNKELMAGTLVVKTCGYDAKTLDYTALQAAFDSEVAAGTMKLSDPGWLNGSIKYFLNSYGGNRIHVTNIDAATSEGKTVAELEGRRVMMRLYRFCRKQPGLENFNISYCATECGIRETVTIKAKKYITVHDYLTGRLFDDAVCYSFYPIDLHNDHSLEYQMIGEGIYPTIPLGAMLPTGSEGIIVAGRCVSGDQRANSAFRVESSCMAMGQAAGAVAALAVKQNKSITSIPMKDIHALLQLYGAIVPGSKD
ncbi:MAG: FAD-dependent oxidoreductase [Elusimicrobiota bacterium]